MKNAVIELYIQLGTIWLYFNTHTQYFVFFMDVCICIDKGIFQWTRTHIKLVNLVASGEDRKKTGLGIRVKGDCNFIRSVSRVSRKLETNMTRP